MRAPCESNIENQSNNRNKARKSPKTPLVKRNASGMLDFAFNNASSQSDVQWGEHLNNSVCDDSPVINKKRKANVDLFFETPPTIRVIKRCVSSPALQGDATRKRSDPSSKLEEGRNLLKIFEEDENKGLSSQELDFGDDKIDKFNKKELLDAFFDNSFDDVLATIPLDVIENEAVRGNQKVFEIKFDPVQGESQIVIKDRDNGSKSVKTFERHNSLPTPALKKETSPEDNSLTRKCTKEEIEEKRRQAMAKLHSKKNVTMASQLSSARIQPVAGTSSSKTTQKVNSNLSNAAAAAVMNLPSSSNIVTTGTDKKCTPAEIEAKRLKALEIKRQRMEKRN